MVNQAVVPQVFDVTTTDEMVKVLCSEYTHSDKWPIFKNVGLTDSAAAELAKKHLVPLSALERVFSVTKVSPRWIFYPVSPPLDGRYLVRDSQTLPQVEYVVINGCVYDYDIKAARKLNCEWAFIGPYR
tara:strand:+ start:21330 stop:21716 length:387 start_codon:yes stop_codon:yes gene_type:complete